MCVDLSRSGFAHFPSLDGANGEAIGHVHLQAKYARPLDLVDG